MADIERIRTDFYVSAMVAGDTIELLAERVKRLVSHGRRIAMTQRYIHTGNPPHLFAGLTVASTNTWPDAFSVRLEPGALFGFGFSVEQATEAEAWKLYHTGLADSPDFQRRRRDITHVEITGGVYGASRDDQIVISEWNGDGACDERVIAFDNTRGQS